MQANTNCGEIQGGLQAPYVLRDGERFLMFYGGWEHICLAASAAGKQFERVLNAQGKATLFGDGAGNNTRDSMVLRVGDLWYCYCTAYPQAIGADYCRTSSDLREWSQPRVVARGGQSGNNRWSAECPFVVQLGPDKFYLFRTQRYGSKAQTSVYFSSDPFDFGVDHDEGHFVCALPVAAPEIVHHDGQWFIAVLLPNLKGIHISLLTWVK